MVFLSMQPWKFFRFLSDHRHPQAPKPAISSSLEIWEEEGVVDEPIHPHHPGRVYFHGTWWPARCLQDLVLATGETVRVIGYQNITLIVEPFSQRY